MNFSFWFVENADQKRFGAKQKFFHLINGLIKSRYSQNVRGKLFRRFFSGDGEFRVVFGRLIKNKKTQTTFPDFDSCLAHLNKFYDYKNL